MKRIEKLEKMPVRKRLGKLVRVKRK